MTAAILSIGTELTRGELVNTNAAWLSEELTKLGFEITEHVTVDDDIGRIVKAIEVLGSRHQVVVSTGGLGPTSDDLTTEAAAKAKGVGLFRDEDTVEDIRKKFAAFGRVMPEANAKQGDFPDGSTILPNAVGTAPGFAMEFDGARFFFVPGVPREMKYLFERSIVPAIADLADRTTHQIHFRTFGLTESGAAERVRDLEAKHPGLTLGFRAHFPEIEVKVHMRADTLAAAQAKAKAAASEVRERLGDAVFGGKDDEFADIVGQALRRHGVRLAVAESCTGGRVGAMLTSIPGSSDYLLLDAVAYSNSAKQKVLGIDSELLRAYGAVSPECAAAMAEGARRLVDADMAVSITGIAGPDGGSDDKPVGTVWFALAQRGKPTVTKHRRLPGDRDRVQTLSAYIALELVRRAAAGRALDLD